MNWSASKPTTHGWYWFRPGTSSGASEPRSTKAPEVAGLWWPEPLAPPPEPGFFESHTFGRLLDSPENRMAAHAADVLGWPYRIMTGASPTQRSPISGLNLVEMAATLYDPRTHDVYVHDLPEDDPRRVTYERERGGVRDQG